MKLYTHPLSGNGHRVQTFLKILGLDFETIIVDLRQGEHKKDWFLKLNPLGQVPALSDGDFTLRESTAIMVYLALKYDTQRKWLPQNPQLAGEVQSWLAVCTKEMYEGPATARRIKIMGAPLDHASALASANATLGNLFEPHLAANEWLVGGAPTIADLANHPYLHVAGEGDIDMAKYPNTQAWLKRVETIKGFEVMPSAASIMGG